VMSDAGVMQRLRLVGESDLLADVRGAGDE